MTEYLKIRKKAAKKPTSKKKTDKKLFFVAAAGAFMILIIFLYWNNTKAFIDSISEEPDNVEGKTFKIGKRQKIQQVSSYNSREDEIKESPNATFDIVIRKTSI